MTEKRFVVKAKSPLWVTNDGIEIESACHDLFDNFEEKIICQFEYDMETEKMVNLLNSLSEENEQLKKRLKLSNDNVEILQHENEQLKKQNKDLFEKLKFTAEQVNYSENLRKLLEEAENKYQES